MLLIFPACLFVIQQLIKVGWFATYLMIPALFAMGYFFYHYDFATPSLWMALLFPFIRLLYSAIIFIGGVGLSFRFLKLLTRLSDIPFHTIIGRLTYSAYLCHLCLIKMSLFNTRSFFRYELIDIVSIFETFCFKCNIISSTANLLIICSTGCHLGSFHVAFLSRGLGTLSRAGVTVHGTAEAAL